MRWMHCLPANRSQKRPPWPLAARSKGLNAALRLESSFLWLVWVCWFRASQRRRNRAADARRKPAIVVHQVDLEGFKQLLHPDPKHSKALAGELLGHLVRSLSRRVSRSGKDRQRLPVERTGLHRHLARRSAGHQNRRSQIPAQMHATMPTYLLNVSDPEPAILSVDPKWGGALPATFLYDAEGKVVFKQFGRIKTPTCAPRSKN